MVPPSLRLSLLDSFPFQKVLPVRLSTHFTLYGDVLDSVRVVLMSDSL